MNTPTRRQPVAVLSLLWPGYDPAPALEHADPRLNIQRLDLSATARHLDAPSLNAASVREWMEDNDLSVIRSSRTGQDTICRQWHGRYSLLIGQPITA